MHSFKDKLLQEVLANKHNDLHDNHDELQCGKLPEATKRSLLQRFLDKRIPLDTKLPVDRNIRHTLRPSEFYRNIIDQFEDVSFLYNLLDDDESKKLLVKIFAYKILGYKKVKLPRNNPIYWSDNKRAESFDVGKNSINIDFVNFRNLTLPLLDLSPLGYKIKLNTHHIAVACIYIQRQYEYNSNNVRIKAEPGDIVLDGGACFGDSTLYFSHEVGSEGKVFAFEFVPTNLDILNLNINQNSHLTNNIEVIQHPMWNVSNEELFCAERGPGSSVNYEKPSDLPDCMIFKTISIDDLVEKNNLRSVDFIKMDIEGSELNALRGGEKTIKRFKPKLAISVYHKPDDFVSIPKYLDSLDLGYKFYLDHHTIHVWETVLYALPVQ